MPLVSVTAFTSESCAACRRDKPILEEIRRNGFPVTEVNGEDQGIGLPYYVVRYDGKVVLTTHYIARVRVFLVRYRWRRLDEDTIGTAGPSSETAKIRGR